MAVIRQRLNRKNALGTYDTIHLETNSSMVLRNNGTTVEASLSALEEAANTQQIWTGGGCLTLGGFISWAGYCWQIFDIDAGHMVVALDHIPVLTKFGDNSTYAGSTLAAVAANFEASLPPDALLMAEEVTVSGVTGKIFVPTSLQLVSINAIYSIFGYPNMRTSNMYQCRYQDRNAEWWGSNKYNNSTNMVFVYGHANAGHSATEVTSTYGFRPFVTLRL